MHNVPGPVPFVMLLPSLLQICLHGTAYANMDAVITQLKGGPAGLRAVPRDKLPARFLADMNIKPEAAAPAAKPAPAPTPARTRAAPPATDTVVLSPPRRSTTIRREETTNIRETTETWGNRRQMTTETRTTNQRQVTFYEDVDEEYEFNGIVWPKGKYGIYADLKDFDMSDAQKVTSRNARPKAVETKDDGKFTVKFITSSRSREPDTVYMHIFGGKKERHLYLDVSDVQWDDVYIFDLNKPGEMEVMVVRPRRVAEELRKLEERDRPPVKKEEPKPQPTIQKLFAGLVWPTTERYTVLVSPREFDLDARGGPVKKRDFHPEPTKAETNQKGMFDTKLVLTERPDSFYVWVTNNKGDKNLFVIPASDTETSKYALDMRTGKVQPFQRLENVLRKLKSVGMINNQQIPYASPPKAAEPAKPAPAAAGAGSDLLKSIKSMVDDLGKALEKKIEQQHAKLKQDIEHELEERVGKKLISVGKRLGLVDDTLQSLYKKLPREIEDVVAAEFDLLYKKKLIGKLDGRA